VLGIDRARRPRSHSLTRIGSGRSPRNSTEERTWSVEGCLRGR
jgi:hypothetical protein